MLGERGRRLDGSSAALPAWLALVRAPLAPTAALDAAACLGLALSGAGRAPGSVGFVGWALLVLTAVLVYAFGMALNDLVDRDRDRVLAPDRPLPSGRIHPGRATALVVALAVAALAIGGGPAGSRLAVAVALAAAALYDLVPRNALGLGAAALGLARFANAAVAVTPLVLDGRAPLLVGIGPLAVGLYAAAVTVWSTTEDVDRPARRLTSRALALAAFVLAGLGPWLVVGHPTLGLVVAAGAVSSLAFARTPRAGPPKRQVLEMLLGLYFLGGSIASGTDGGSLVAGAASIALAFALIFLSQVSIRALARARRAV